MQVCAPNCDQPSARSTTTDTKWGRITPKTHQNRGYARQISPKQRQISPKQRQISPKQRQNPPNQAQNLPKTGYLQIGTTPATHTVRCDADATHKAWTTIPSDVSGGHDRQGFIRVTASSAMTPFAGRARENGDGVPAQRWQRSHAPGAPSFADVHPAVGTGVNAGVRHDRDTPRVGIRLKPRSRTPR